MSKHTPGPWEIIWEQRGAIITARDGCYDVAVVRDIGNEDNKANAKLISAATEFFDGAEAFVAYEAAMRAGKQRDGVRLYDIASKKLRAAIAKATGEQ